VRTLQHPFVHRVAHAPALTTTIFLFQNLCRITTFVNPALLLVFQLIIHYTIKTPLWDGEGCRPTSSGCCQFNNPPWFCKHLNEPVLSLVCAKDCLSFVAFAQFFIACSTCMWSVLDLTNCVSLISTPSSKGTNNNVRDEKCSCYRCYGFYTTV